MAAGESGLELGDSIYRVPPPLEDGPRVSLPPGTVRYGYRDGPFHSQVADNSLPPRLTGTNEGYIYETSFGDYSFSRALPFVFTLNARSGTSLTSGSMFFVNASAALEPGRGSVTTATDSRFEVTYPVHHGSTTVGSVSLVVDFAARTPPKFTASFTRTAAWNLGSFNMVWSTLPLQKWAATEGAQAAMDLQSVPGLKLAENLSIEVGPTEDRSRWTEWLTTDWMDAGAGDLEIREISIGPFQGRGFTIVFPRDMAIVDPTQVGSSTDWLGATGFPTQRKTFYYGDYYFLFWYDGTNIVYSSSKDGISWSNPSSTGSDGSANWSFDVANLGSTVALAWYDQDPSPRLGFKTGSIVGSAITWSQLPAFFGMPAGSQTFPPSLTIGDDGRFWFAGIWADAYGNYEVKIFSSPDGIDIALNFSYPVSCQSDPENKHKEVVELTPLSRGRIMLLSTGFCDTSLHWRTWDPLAGTWSSPQNLLLGLSPGMSKEWLYSATTAIDGFVYVLYSPAGDQVRWAYYNNATLQWTLGGQVYNGPSSFPTISSDPLGNLYAFWLPGSLHSQAYPMYSWKPTGSGISQGWSAPTQPFGTGAGGGGNTGLTAVNVAFKQVFAAWTVDCTWCGYNIMFGSLPLPAGIASSPPSQPWNKLGLSSDIAAGEYVSPGNGLLAVSQTDIVASGRNGLDFSISRTYLQPHTFLQGNPFNIETSPYTNIGKGWQLNLPWVGPEYLHLANGQVFPIMWTDKTTGGETTVWKLENHEGDDFVFTKTSSSGTTTFKLETPDGTVHNFNSAGLLSSITDRTGQNSILFTYNPLTGFLRFITDSVGRVATLSYDPSNRVSNVWYAGRYVFYGYSGDSLSTVTDWMGNTVSFRYTAPNSWLLSGVIYPTGGNSTYTYGSITIGTDAVNYYVALQNLYAGSLARSTSFSYLITDGTVSTTDIAQSDGVSTQGFIVHEFNPKSRAPIVTVFDSNWVQMKKTVTWYDSNGKVVQEDVYNGNTSSRSFYNSYSYDSWGNIIYTRNALDHETYASYANTDSQYRYHGPGKLTPVVDGKTLYDDFNFPTLDTSAWAPGSSTIGPVILTWFSQLTLEGGSTAPGIWKSTWVRSLTTYSYPFYAEVQMSLGNNPGSSIRSAEFMLSPQTSGDPFGLDALRLQLAQDTGAPIYRVWKNVGGVQTPIFTSNSLDGESMSVSWKLVLLDQNTLWVHLNAGSGYRVVYSTTTLGLSSGFTPSYVFLGLHTTNIVHDSASFDYVSLSKSNSITINGLQNGQQFEVYDWSDVMHGARSGASADLTSMVFPYGYVKVFEPDGRTVQFVSPTREIWGGTVYSYSPPFRSGGLSRTFTGFLSSLYVYIEDDVNADSGGAILASEGGDSWLFAGNPYAPIVSGEESHIGFTASGLHQHYFYGGTRTLSATSEFFHIQYVYIPSNTVPRELMLQFREAGGSWEHRAYWGENLITQWGADGTDSRRPMGPLPAARDEWIMLIVKTDDVGTDGRTIDGLAYTLYDGGVYWDYSVYGLFDTGSLKITNLLPGQRVELYDSAGSLRVSGTLQAGQTLLLLDLYGAGINAFPFKGTIKVYDASGSLEYVSPLMTDIWGGDAYRYNRPVFSKSFIFSSISDSIHSRVVGSAQFQNAGAVPQESYSKYDTVGNLVEQRLMHNASPLTTSYTYDVYGNPTTIIDAEGNTISYSYSPTYNYAYLTSETGTAFSSIFSDGFGQTLAQWTPQSGTWSLETGELSGSGTGAQIVSTQSFPSDRTFQARARTVSAGSQSGDVAWVTGKYVDATHKAVIILGTTGTLELLIWYGSEFHYTISTGLSPFDWHDFKAVFAGNNAKIYVDNVLYLDVTDSSIGALGDSKIQLVSWGTSHSHFDDVLVESSTTITTVYAYDLSKGVLTSTTDPMGNTVSYQYDLIGRTTLITFPPVNGVASNVLTVYQDSENAVATRNEKGNYTRQVYDGLGRRITVERYSGDLSSAILSVERYTYDWQGNVKTYMAPDGNVTRHDYDFLSRLVKVTHPDDTYRTVSYDDLNLIESRLDENQHRTDYRYDNLHHLAEVREFYSASSYYSTLYPYDSVGNLVMKVASNQQVLAFTPTDDTYIRADLFDANFGAATTLQIDSSPVIHSLLKFTISGVGSAQVASARLRLYNTDSSPMGGAFYKTDTITWSENSTIWEDAPATQGSAIASLGSVSANNWYTVDLTSAVTGDGVLSLRVTSSNSNNALYTSRQGTEGFRPQLLVTTSALQSTTYTYDDLDRSVLTKYPDGFNETRTYDNIGNLVSKKDPNGSTMTYDYDGLNRLTAITYPGGSTASFSYDKNSNMVRASNSDGSVSFSYDARDRPTGETWTISGTDYSLSYGYDAVGNMVSLTYPDNKVVSYSVDPLDRVSTVKTGATTLATIGYASNTAVQAISYGNGVLTTYSYDSAAQPTRIKVARGSTTLLDLNYTYDPAGNIDTITRPNYTTETYDYDYLDRLTYSSGPWATLQYGYDSAGNRLLMQSGSTTTGYTYGPYNRLVGVGSTLAYSYDNNENLKIKTSGSTVYTYSYDFENRLTKVMQGASTLGTYNYSPLGDRIESVESGTATTYINSGYDTLYEKSVSGSTTTINDYVYLGTVVLAKLIGTTVYYFHQDHLGSTRLVTLGTSTSYSSNYQPFGPQYGASGTDPGYKYTGKLSSSAIGLSYYGARWYDPTIGRFIGKDPVQGQTFNPQSLNPYVYVSNRPMTFTDPTGMNMQYTLGLRLQYEGLPAIVATSGAYAAGVLYFYRAWRARLATRDQYTNPPDSYIPPNPNPPSRIPTTLTEIISARHLTAQSVVPDLGIGSKFSSGPEGFAGFRSDLTGARSIDFAGRKRHLPIFTPLTNIGARGVKAAVCVAVGAFFGYVSLEAEVESTKRRGYSYQPPSSVVWPYAGTGAFLACAFLLRHIRF